MRSGISSLVGLMAPTFIPLKIALWFDDTVLSFEFNSLMAVNVVYGLQVQKADCYTVHNIHIRDQVHVSPHHCQILNVAWALNLLRMIGHDGGLIISPTICVTLDRTSRLKATVAALSLQRTTVAGGSSRSSAYETELIGGQWLASPACALSSANTVVGTKRRPL